MSSFPIEISVISLKLSPKVAVVSTYTPITLPINFIATNICGYGRYAPTCIPSISLFSQLYAWNVMMLASRGAYGGSNTAYNTCFGQG